MRCLGLTVGRSRQHPVCICVERALDIIGEEVKSQLLDPVLFRLFVEAKIYQLTEYD